MQAFSHIVRAGILRPSAVVRKLSNEFFTFFVARQFAGDTIKTALTWHLSVTGRRR
jgi:hypothetical protein